MVVLKFGGSSVKDAVMIHKVAEIIQKASRKDKILVVLSALQGCTDMLIEASVAASKARSTKTIFSKMYQRHLLVWKQLSKKEKIPLGMEQTFSELEESLHGISLVKESTIRTQDLIMSFGERLSCQLLVEYMSLHGMLQSEIRYIDARKYIITDDSFGEARVHFPLSEKKLSKALKNAKFVPVVTGFIASTKDGITTTLGRNGSDYTAAILSAVLDAKRLEIWTDVDGILSADPRMVPDAYVIKKISYIEAMELSFYGANVIHPLAIVPAVGKEIPILIKNTMNTASKGTLIQKKSRGDSSRKMPFTGLASISRSSMLTVEGAGLSGNFYFLPKIFNVFARNHIQPLMIAQASCEHSICFVFEEKDIYHIREKMLLEFKNELASRRIQNITILKDVSIISIIGTNMRGVTGLAGKLFTKLGEERINIIAISQGSNESNVSVVIERKQEKKALCLLHSGFSSEKKE